MLAIARNVPDGFAAGGWGTPLNALVSMGDVDGGRLLAGFAGVRPLDTSDRSAVTDAVRAFIPDAEIVAHGGHDWNADRFSRGAWFAEPPGWQRTIEGEDLEAPLGRWRSPGVTSRGPAPAGSRARSPAVHARPRGSVSCSPRAGSRYSPAARRDSISTTLFCG